MAQAIKKSKATNVPMEALNDALAALQHRHSFTSRSVARQVLFLNPDLLPELGAADRYDRIRCAAYRFLEKLRQAGCVDKEGALCGRHGYVRKSP